MRTSTARRLAALGAVVVLLSGCGGSDEPLAPVDPPSLSDPAQETPEIEPTPAEPPSEEPDVETDTQDGDEEPLPESFLAPAPDDSAVRKVSELGTDVIVEFGVPGEQLSAGQAYRDLLEGEGFVIENEQETTSSTGDSGLGFRASNDTFSMQVTTGTDRFEPEQATISCSFTTDPA